MWISESTAAVLSHIFRLTLHKIYLVNSGIRLKVPIWQIFKHDLSKYWLSEIFAYSQFFFMNRKNPKKWRYAWLHHINHNRHHWEYYLSRSTNEKYHGKYLEMPRSYAREMVADWMSASKVKTGSWDISEWLRRTWPKMRFHDDTSIYVKKLLHQNGYNIDKIIKGAADG